jgi:hypothetical protein
MRVVEILIGQEFCACEFFVHARFAQMFRRCIEFCARLSVRRKKQQHRFATANPITTRKAASLSSRKLIAMVHRASMTLSLTSPERSDHSPRSPS